MDKQIVYLPFDQECVMFPEVQGGDWQRLTVTDLETKQVLINGWEAQGEGQLHAPVKIRTAQSGIDPLGYRIEVLMQSAKGGQRTNWQPSRTALFAGGREKWSYCTVGSEDCESTDNDWNDCSVAFVIDCRLFAPLFALTPLVADGIRQILKGKSPNT